MKKIVLFFVLIANAINVLSAQLDTIGKYPYLYHYNWPETGVVQSDSVYCNVYLSSSGYKIGGDDLAWWVDYLDSIGGRVCEYAVYQHTDTPLTVIGLAIGNQVNMSRYKTITLYDSSMTEIYSIRGIFSSETIDSLRADTDAHHFYFPGIGLPDPTATSDPSETIWTYVYYAFFDKEVMVTGDYYIGYHYETTTCMWNDPGYMAEIHGAPYHFASPYRYRIDTIWSPIRTSRYVPTLFSILKFPCEPLDSISMVAETDGCLHVDWEAPELQSSWTVCLTLPNGSEIVQPTDTNHWEYCGITPGAYYRVKVRSRCDDIDGHSWSDWSREFSIGHQAIDGTTTEPPFTVSPNPASGTVTVDCDVADGTIEVVDMQGRTVLTVPSTQRTLDISRLAAGSYVVRLTTPQGTAVRRLQVE